MVPQVERSALAHARPRTKSASYTYASPTRATLHKLALENENDVRLYRHALALLDCRLQRCGLEPAASRARRPSEPPSSTTEATDSGDSAGSETLAFETVANAAAKHLLRRRHHAA